MTYLSNIRVQWCRKSGVQRSFPFNIEKPKNWKTEFTRVIKQIPLQVVDRETFNRIANTLQALPLDILRLASMNKHNVAIKCEDDYLAIDTQGYDYPRYKSFVVFQENY